MTTPYNPYEAPRAAPAHHFAAVEEEAVEFGLAGRDRRFAAHMLDELVFAGPIGGIYFGVLAALGKSKDAEGPAALAAIAIGVLPLVLQIGAQVTWGQSIGKRLLRIKVVMLDGAPPSLWRILLVRSLAIHVMGALCGLVGLADAVLIFDSSKRCLHDHMAGTTVVNA